METVRLGAVECRGLIADWSQQAKPTLSVTWCSSTHMSDKSNPTENIEITDVEHMLERLGVRVRAKRAERRMPRRVLSELSGVSPRYLAQLEVGQGNISVGLLKRVSHALNVSLTDLLGESADQDEERLRRLYRAADKPTQMAIMQRLEMAADIPDRAQRICLLGLRGAGKSTLGYGASEALGVPFIELNQDIEAQGGMPVADIMAQYGTDGYRQLEAEAVRRVAARHDRIILAVAGGVVSEPDTYNTLLARFHTVWVKASPEAHASRIEAQDNGVVMNMSSTSPVKLDEILQSRSPEYGRSDVALDTTDQTPEVSVQQLVKLIRANNFLG